LKTGRSQKPRNAIAAAAGVAVAVLPAAGPRVAGQTATVETVLAATDLIDVNRE